MDGAGQSPGEESGMIRRMQSNWAEEVILLQEDKEEELVEEEKQVCLSHLSGRGRRRR